MLVLIAGILGAGCSQKSTPAPGYDEDYYTKKNVTPTSAITLNAYPEFVMNMTDANGNPVPQPTLYQLIPFDTSSAYYRSLERIKKSPENVLRQQLNNMRLKDRFHQRKN